MMVIKIIESDPAVSEAGITAFERRANVVLPGEYKRWLLAHNGGRPDPSGFRYKGVSGPYTDSSVSVFFNLFSVEACATEFKVWQRRLPDELIAVADDSFGNMVCIGISGPHEGKVYFWDHEEETEPASFANCHLVADSFDEFLNLLH